MAKKKAKASKKSATKKVSGQSVRTPRPSTKTTRPRTHAAKARGKRVSKKPATAKAASAAAAPDKLVYFFGAGEADGDASMSDLLGAKGANLAEMTSLGLPVPPGFTITTEACDRYHRGGDRLPHGLMNECHRTMAAVQKESGRVFGDAENPLLVSVRSGAAVSMPGMLDTVLNLGLNDDAVEGLAKTAGDRRFAHDAYRRLIAAFGTIVMGIDPARFDAALAEAMERTGAAAEADIPEEAMVELSAAYQRAYEKAVADPFPQNPFKQLELAIEAAFRGWDSPRAQAYRRLHGIVGLRGTAVSVQAMVFGNLGEPSCTGIAYTRDPGTGENTLYGEFLPHAQGDDVISGGRSPVPLAELAGWHKGSAQKLAKIKKQLESHYKDMQYIEFTVERGELHMLQCRAGRRTGRAAVRIACDLVKEKLLTEEEALLRIPAGDMEQMLLHSLDAGAKASAARLATGLPASPGAFAGRPVFSAAEALELAGRGERAVLVLSESTPDDLEGLHAAGAIVTSGGGLTSHAALVARGWGTPCVVGAASLAIDAAAGTVSANGETVDRDGTISVDGASGEVVAGYVPLAEPAPPPEFARVLRWADKHRTLGVRAEIADPDDAAAARELGAEGIGLCRTSAMFAAADRLPALQAMLLADTPADRASALAPLAPLLRDDFIALFESMKGTPVTVMLLDVFPADILPDNEPRQARLARTLGIDQAAVERRAAALREANPEFGLRGSRLAVVYPELLAAQMRAVSEAAIECVRRKVRAQPEVVLPLVGSASEMVFLRELCMETVHEVRREQDFPGRLDVKIGAMIGTARGAVAAAALAEVSDFLLFASDDLTRSAFGASRADAARYLPEYLAREVIEADPFVTIERAGVGVLIRDAAAAARQHAEQIRVGLSGAHGGDPESVVFCHEAGLDYVTCPPRRLPIAKLAAAQAVLRASRA